MDQCKYRELQYSDKTPNYIWLGVEECDAWNKIKTAEGSHTAGEIVASTLQVWNWETPTRVTDNAANEKKAFEPLQWVRS